MDRLIESIPFLVAPFVACLVIASLHCYMGLHVIKRGVIFVDLALAQSAALGAAVALVIGPAVCDEPHAHGIAHDAPAVVSEADLASQFDEAFEGDADWTGAIHETDHDHADAHAPHEHEHASLAYGLSLVFSLLGAVLMAFSRLKDDRIPHEAIIGIVFVVCAAVSVLILSKAPHGHERMQAMLVGSILFVNWSDVAQMSMLYLGLGIVHYLLRRHFLQISQGVRAAEHAGKRVRLWDCVFYSMFALMVTQSVAIAGVLVVFSYLIIPGVCASLVTGRFRSQLGVAWIVAAITTVLGLAVSALADMPTGASLVSCFGAVLVLFAVARSLQGRSTTC